MESPVKRALVVGALVLVAIVALYTVWPTPWRIETACGRLVRINRFTGRASVLLDNGWNPLRPNRADDLLRSRESERMGFWVYTGLLCPPTAPVPARPDST